MAMQLVTLLYVMILNLTSVFAATVNEAYGGDINTGCPLETNIYQYSCPQAETVIFSWVEQAVSSDPRMAASLLRLHFHDCFVNASLSFFTTTYCFFFFNFMNCVNIFLVFSGL